MIITDIKTVIISALLRSRFISRLRELDELKTKSDRIYAEWRAMGLTSFGDTGRKLASCHNEMAREFNSKKYGWMKSIAELTGQGLETKQ